jgi:hypothetical protein
MFLIEVLLPVYDNDRAAFGRSLYSDVRRELSERFGGVTTFARAPAEGFWKQEDGDVVKDDIVIFEVMSAELDREWWARYREQVRRRFRQDQLVVRATSLDIL